MKTSPDIVTKAKQIVIYLHLINILGGEGAY